MSGSALQPDTDVLLTRLCAFLFPGGEQPARAFRGIRTTQRGEFRASANAHWTALTAEESIDATCSSFRWEARIGAKLGFVVVTDAYENGHGRLTVKAGGIVPLQKLTGPELDKGELQRYFAAVIYCPPIVLNHPSLEWSAVAPFTLRVRDRADGTGAAIDLEIDEDGRPIACRAERPRLVGKQALPTPWFATASDWRELEGIRVPGHLEAAWHLPEGPFTYFRAEVTSCEFVR